MTITEFEDGWIIYDFDSWDEYEKMRLIYDKPFDDEDN